MSARLLGVLILFPALAATADGGPLRRLDAHLLRDLAARYEHAEGVPRDYQRAYRLYCLAATQGDAKAQYSLGWMYINGPVCGLEFRSVSPARCARALLRPG